VPSKDMSISIFSVHAIVVAQIRDLNELKPLIQDQIIDNSTKN